jgi:hypothetical protein
MSYFIRASKTFFSFFIFHSSSLCHQFFFAALSYSIIAFTVLLHALLKSPFLINFSSCFIFLLKQTSLLSHFPLSLHSSSFLFLLHLFFFFVLYLSSFFIIFILSFSFLLCPPLAQFISMLIFPLLSF